MDTLPEAKRKRWWNSNLISLLHRGYSAHRECRQVGWSDLSGATSPRNRFVWECQSAVCCTCLCVCLCICVYVLWVCVCAWKAQWSAVLPQLLGSLFPLLIREKASATRVTTDRVRKRERQSRVFTVNSPSPFSRKRCKNPSRLVFS